MKTSRPFFPRLHPVLLLLAVGLLLGAAGCKKKPAVEIVELEQLPDAFFPYTATKGFADGFFDFFFEPLCRPQPGRSPAPLIARVVKHTPTRAIFAIDQRAHFSDGRPVTSADVLFSWSVVSGDNLFNGPHRVYFKKVQTIRQLDQRRFEVRFRQAHGANLKTACSLLVLPQHYYQPLRRQDPTLYRSLSRVRPLGTGPWLLAGDQGSASDGLRLVPDPHYWRGDGRAVKNVVRLLRVAKNAQADGVSADKDRAPARNGRSYLMIGWNLQSALAQDLNLRQAMAHLVRLESFRRAPAEKINPPAAENAWCPPIHAYTFDHPLAPSQRALPPFAPQKAQQLVQDAGWTRPANGGPLQKDRQPLVLTIAFAKEQAQTYKPGLIALRDAARGIGIAVKFASLPFKELFYTAITKGHEGILFRIEVPEAMDLDLLWHSRSRFGHGANLFNYKNPAIDALLDRFNAAADEERKKTLVGELRQMLVRDQPVLFVAETCEGLTHKGSLAASRTIDPRRPHAARGDNHARQ